MNTLGAHVALATNDVAAGYGATYTTPNNMQVKSVENNFVLQTVKTGQFHVITYAVAVCIYTVQSVIFFRKNV